MMYNRPQTTRQRSSGGAAYRSDLAMKRSLVDAARSAVAAGLVIRCLVALLDRMYVDKRKELFRSNSFKAPFTRSRIGARW
jgi:hypothetical protein